MMGFEAFIASKIFLKGKANFSRPIVRLGIFSVALGIAVMTISLSIVTGFQKQVRDKVIGFGAHIQITGYEVNQSLEANPVSKDQPFYPHLDSINGISHIQVFATKAGILKTEDQIEGVILKGIGTDFNWQFFEQKIVEGSRLKLPDSNASNEIMISRQLAQKLLLKLGDPLRMYFINKDEMQPRGRKFTISGIYKTGLEEFDRLYVIGDIRHIRKLNKWKDDEIGGFEVLVDDYNRIDEMKQLATNFVGYDLVVKSIRDIHPQIFDWLSLQDMNVVIIMVLMTLVAGITMISTLLILILEKTNMIGILKSLGTKNLSVRKIFIYNAIYIIGSGMLWGNMLSLVLSFIQLRTGIFKLNQESYYVSEIPVNLDLTHYLLINAGTLLICTLLLILPTYIITRISPVKAIRFS